MEIILAILALIYTFITILFFRNLRVLSHRGKILNYIYHKNVKEINEGKNDFSYRWRNDAYDDVPYSDMVLKFWQPLDSFFSKKLIDEMKKEQQR